MDRMLVVVFARSCGVEQLDNGVDDTLVSSVPVRFLLSETQPIRICGQYQRPIARVTLFWHIRFNEMK